MLTLARLIFAALRLIYAGEITALESPEFTCRQAALTSLWRAWPLTHEACLHAAATTDSPQVRDRAEHVTEAAPRWLWRTMMAAPADCWDESLAVILADDHEYNGLPWMREGLASVFEGSDPATAALARLVEKARQEGWIAADFRFGAESPYYPPGLLWEMDDLRFKARDLPAPGEWLEANGYDLQFWWPMRLAWSVRKAQRGK